MYHPHADEMVQMAMGMMGFWITHPKGKHPLIDEVDRDFCFLLNAYDIDPGSYHAEDHDDAGLQPVELEQPHLPGHRPAGGAAHGQGAHPHRQPDDDQPPDPPARARVPVTGTDGGPTPKSTRWPEVTADIAVGQMRQIDFLADEEGDWAFHCHKSHHTMNAMGHDVPTMIGVDHRGVAKQITQADPRLHGDGRARHEGHDRDGDAAARQHRADDDRHRGPSARSAWAACSACQGAQGPEARRLQRPGLVPAPAGHGGLRVHRRLADPARFKADASPGPGLDAAGGQARRRPTSRSRCASPRRPSATEHPGTFTTIRTKGTS
jgi:hypothetical protein